MTANIAHLAQNETMYKKDLALLYTPRYSVFNKETKMINRTKQNWEVGSQVKVGFLTLTVVKAAIAIKDYMPDIYILKSAKGQHYSFIPHNGLSKLTDKQLAVYMELGA